MITGRTYRLPIVRIGPFVLPFLILIIGVTHLPAQDVYLLEWTIQDPDRDLEQEIASRTIESINFWLTRENVAAQTVRLDDPLRITVIGRYVPRSGTIREEILRVRAGSILIEDDPRLYLQDDLIDTLIRRNYFWSSETIDLVDPSLAPAYLRAGERRRESSPGDSRISVPPPSRPAGYDPAVDIRLADGWHGFVDPGFPEAGLGGLGYGRLRLGAGRSYGSLWAEIPTGLDIDGPFGTHLRPTPGIGGELRLDWATLTGSAGFRTDTVTSPRSDSSRLVVSLLGYGTITSSSPLLGRLFGAVDLGGGLFETGVRRPSVNGTLTERTEHDAAPLIGVRLYPGSGGANELVQLLRVRWIHFSLEAGARIRLLPFLEVQGAVVYDGVGRDSHHWRAPLTFWVSPVIQLEL